MTHIVTTSYRYKRPPRNREAAGIEGPAIVITRIHKQTKHADAPALTTPEAIRHRVDAAADSMWRELVRRATRKDRP